MIHLLYVMEELGQFGAWYGDFDRSHIQKMHEMERQMAEERLASICEKELQGCPLYIRHIAMGDPSSEILKLIGSEKVDVVVIASQGRKGHFGFGSVAEKVVKHSAVPVLTVPIRVD
jgi:nucleotide-binding universal stress UspA family protein